MSDQVQYHNVEGKMDTIFKKTLPESLTQLSKRNESFAQVVSHLEAEYVRTGADKGFVDNEAKAFVAKGLVNILQDIELAAININQLVDLQGVALDSLTTQVDVVQSRLGTMKQQHLQYGLEDMKVASTSRPVTKIDESTNDMDGVSSKDKATYKRIPLEERLARLSAVGLGSAAKQ